MVLAGTEIIIKPSLPYCTDCTKTARRQPVGIGSKLLVSFILFFLFMISLAFIPSSITSVIPVAFTIPIFFILASRLVFGFYSLQKPTGNHTSYYQPVRLKKVKQKFSGEIVGIFYRLLVGDQGARLRQMASAGSPSHQIAQAIDWLKSHYTLPLHIDDLAARVHMSTSAFHHHFRVLTAMSPPQYQKWLRLNEARRLMLTEHLNAATAAFQVGYESPSQFSREYRRFFDEPPLRDIATLRLTADSARVYGSSQFT